MAKPFYENYIDKLSHYDRERYERKIEHVGFDPYELHEEDLSEDISLWPGITPVDRYDYFIYRTQFTTQTDVKMNCNKALEAHNYVTSGLVRHPVLKKVSEENVILLCRVGHGQKHSEPPVRLWLFTKNSGEIISSHCECMAGLGETCSHVSALTIKIEMKTLADKSQTCTDTLCYWLGPTMSTVPYKEVRDMNFTSASSRFKQLQSNIVNNSPPVNQETPYSSTSHRSSVLEEPSPARADSLTSADMEFLSELAASNPDSSVLSTYDNYCSSFIPPETPPKLLKNLFDDSTLDLSLDELVEKCTSLLDSIKFTKEELKEIEVKTRGQHTNKWWFWYRCGRATSSNMYNVWAGDINKPAISTITSICYGDKPKEFHSFDCQRGKELEPKAREKYIELHMRMHQDLKVSENGLFICEEYCFIAASPDGTIYCSCCPGFGVLEIKCPQEKNFLAAFDEDGNLLFDHEYRFQCQTHMLATGASYCDLMVFLEKVSLDSNGKEITETEHKIVRLYPDHEFQASMAAKAKGYFLNVLMPELISTFYSRQRQPLAPKQTDENGITTAICYCQSARRVPFVVCSGPNCTFKEFHCLCVGIKTAPAPPRKWFCMQCQIDKVRADRRQKKARQRKEQQRDSNQQAKQPKKRKQNENAGPRNPEPRMRKGQQGRPSMRGRRNKKL